MPELGGSTQDFGGRTVPKFFDSSVDVNAAGVSGASLHSELQQPLLPYSHLLRCCGGQRLAAATCRRPNTKHKAAGNAHCRATCPHPCLLPQVYSLMNLAWAKHEIISDYVTVALLWFESGCVPACPACSAPACSNPACSPPAPFPGYSG